MAQCGGVSANILIDCNNPPVGGSGNTMYLINKADIDTLTFDTTGITPQKIVEAITLNAGKFAWKVEGRNNSISGSVDLVKGTYFDTYDHKVNGVLFDITPATKAQIEKMVQSGDLIAIIENNNRSSTGNTAFEMYGYNVGLDVMTLARNTNENDGVYLITWGSPENTKEPQLPYSVFDTDYATTKALLEALLD